MTEVARILGVHPRTLERRRGARKAPRPLEAQREEKLHRIWRELIGLFTTEDAIYRLTHPVPALEDRLPVELMAEDGGLARVTAPVRDYGAVGFAHGRYAEELEVYVRDAGIPALEVLRWATKHGAELMGRGDELGTVAEGKLADLLVLDGDPLDDVALLQDRDRILAIVKDGVFVKDALAAA